MNQYESLRIGCYLMLIGMVVLFDIPKPEGPILIMAIWAFYMVCVWSARKEATAPAEKEG